MKFLFVVNSAASGVRVSEMERGIRARWPGGSIEILTDPLRGELRDRCAAIEPGDGAAVVAVGGDGTVNRILNAIGPRQVPIGILPRGRANDFARELRIPFGFADACTVLERGETVAVDLVSVNGTRFATCGGTDAAAAVAELAARWSGSPGAAGLIRHLGAGAYAAAAIRTLLGGIPSVSFRVETGGVSLERRALAVLVSNQRRFGCRFQASPWASNRDGRIDLSLLPELGRSERIAAAVRCAWTGDLSGLGDVGQITAPEARIAASRDVRFFGDGEILAEGRDFHLCAHPRAARVIAPAEPPHEDD